MVEKYAQLHAIPAASAILGTHHFIVERRGVNVNEMGRGIVHREILVGKSGDLASHQGTQRGRRLGNLFRSLRILQDAPGGVDPMEPT